MKQTEQEKKKCRLRQYECIGRIKNKGGKLRFFWKDKNRKKYSGGVVYRQT